MNISVFFLTKQIWTFVKKWIFLTQNVDHILVRFCICVQPWCKYWFQIKWMIEGSFCLFNWDERHRIIKKGEINSSQKVRKLFFIGFSWKMCWILSIKFHIIEKPMSLHRHLIHYNRILLSEDMALWIWVGRKSNVPKWNIFSAHNSS